MTTHQKRMCLVGTAPSWQSTPWTDPTLECWTLNDAYMLGLPRINRLYDLHPLDKMYFRPPQHPRVLETDVPPGFFVRPAGHLETLKAMAQTIPVFLQETPPDDWPPNAHRFPIEAVEAVFGKRYWASGPSYMLAQAFLEGYTEMWITGIHLSTEHEYREQRPQFEMLIGQLLGAQVTETVQDGWRIYDGAVRIVLPESSPILQHGWRYAYEPKPTPPVGPYDVEWRAVTKEKAALVTQLIHWPAGQDKTAALARLKQLEIIALDIQQQTQKAQLGGTLTITIQPAMPIVPEEVPHAGRAS